MRNAFLIQETGSGVPRRVAVESFITIGRAAECGLVINDPACSRKHLEISRDESAYRWRDLGSRNGTLLNGVISTGGVLKPGDRLQIGDVVLRFALEDETSSVHFGLVRETILGSNVSLLPDGTVQDNALGLLRAVYQVMNEIASNFDPCGLIDKILETTVKALQAQHGAVFLADKSSSSLAGCSVCGHIHMIKENELCHADEGEIEISRTVVNHVLNGGESVLYQDTGRSGNLTASESIEALNLRSIVCVPLRGKSGVLGVLYLDTNRVDQRYSREDLLLCAAVGNSAGLALENATFHQQILEKQRIDQEIEFAWTIQKRFLVGDWESADTRFDIYGETLPAKTVGGDFYDYVCPDENHVGVFIGDVSGKGVPAALAMAQILAQFRMIARNGATPKDVMAELNDGLVKRSERGMFCTMCYALIDLRSGEVVWANAGHLPPLLVSRSQAWTLALASGPPAGVTSGAVWSNESATLGAGDILILYTDGIIEARRGDTMPYDSVRYTYGVEGMCEFGQQFGHVSTRELVDGLNRDVRRFCAPGAPHDDCTLIAVRYSG